MLDIATNLLSYSFMAGITITALSQQVTEVWLTNTFALDHGV
jgi:hypothetical protein